jgi:hypothetical protein
MTCRVIDPLRFDCEDFAHAAIRALFFCGQACVVRRFSRFGERSEE